LIYIITGHYGSGKTEVAINLALTLKSPTIIDLDIVNPFFRTKDAEGKLLANGIKLISPEFANTNIDVPSLPPEIFAGLQGENDLVIDAGGDDNGAMALGQFNRYFKEKPYEMYFVINVKRPLTSNAIDIIEMLKSIEAASRIKATALINNTNIKSETTANDLIYGQKIVDEVSNITRLPIKAISGTREILKQIELINTPKLPLDLHLTLPWEVL